MTSEYGWPRDAPRRDAAGAGRSRRLAASPLLLAGLCLVVSAGVVAGQAPGRGGAPPPAAGAPGGGRGGGGPQPEVALVAQFDKDGDKRLNAEERALARAWLATYRNAAAPGGRGGRGGMVPGSPGVRLSPRDVETFAEADFYDPTTLRTIFMSFEAADWEQELQAFYNTDVDVPARVLVDGETYHDVGVAFRGASSFRMIPEGSKRSFNLSFDFVIDGQNVGGYRTLNLLNGNSDPTFLRTMLYSQIAREYIPTPRVNLVRVVVNGENWGVYSSAQQFNKDFLLDDFGTDGGVRWKVPGSPNGRGGMEYLGPDVEQYKRLYEIKSKDEPARWADLVNLFRVLNETPLAELERALEPILDIDGVLRFLALDVALVNTDGYWTRASDYSIYQGEDGRFHVIPHDMNEALGTGGNVLLDPLVGLDDATKPLRSRLLAVPALQERYLAYVRDIAERWLDWGAMAPRIAEYRAMIEADVRRDTRKLYTTEAFENGFADLERFMSQRRAHLLR